MKKLIIIILSLFSFISIYNAECSYKNIKELNILSSYVDVSYTYNDNGTFTLNILNVPNDLIIEVNGIKYGNNNQEVHIPNFGMGQSINIMVISSNVSACSDEKLRSINYSFPYLNNYYGSSKCVGHEELEVCSRKFLNYKLSEKTFNSLIQKALEEDMKKKDNVKKDIKEESNFLIKTINIIEKIRIPIILVIISSAITILICSIIYRKIKHGL